MKESDNLDDEILYLGFINYVGEENDGLKRYELIFTNNKEEFWGEDWDYQPAGLITDLKPLDEYITEIHHLKGKINLDLVQKNCCFSMQDCIDGICALAWENLDGYEEFPEEGRLVLHFGETIDDVETKLSQKNLILM